MARKLFGVWFVILGWYIVNLLGRCGECWVKPPPLISDIYPWHAGVSSDHRSADRFCSMDCASPGSPISIFWTITVSVGLFLGLVVSPILARIWGFQDDESIISLTAAYTTMGLLVGLAQWSFLRGQFTRSWVWPLSSALGFGLGLGLVLATNLIDRSGIVSFFLAALVYAIATGLVLAWLPALRRKTESNLVSAT